MDIEEAESSLREGGFLNSEEARALLGRLEFQRGHIEAALRVFDGIDIASLIPKIRSSITRRLDQKFRSHMDVVPMSLNAISLLLEAMYLKAMALQDLGRFKEAAETCSCVLDTVEFSSTDELPQNFGSGCKFREILTKAIDLLPELWKLAGFAHEAILSYRRALRRQWNLDAKTYARIQKEFAIYLLYWGCDASYPLLRSQANDSFVPRNNIEESLLLFMILLWNSNDNGLAWDESILHHLTFALSLSGGFKVLANQIEELLPCNLERKERYYSLALCYMGEGDNLVALSLLKRLMSATDDPNCLEALLLASKICADGGLYAEGVSFARKSLDNSTLGCVLMRSVANCMLGISLSGQARSAVSEVEIDACKCEAVRVLEKANEIAQGRDYGVIFNLCLETAEQRNLDVALKYANKLLKLEARSNIRTWILCARILSGQKRYADAEVIINAALDETGTWNQGDLLRTKAMIQIAQKQLNEAVQTYGRLLGVLQLRTDNVFRTQVMKDDRILEMETWHDLADIYTRKSQWTDAEDCISKLKSIDPYSVLVWHAIGKLFEAKGLHKDALEAYFIALDLEARHVPSLISAAIILKKMDCQLVLARQLLTAALVFDRTNHIVWFNLGLLYKEEGGVCHLLEASDCFQTAAFLEESSPVESFRSHL